MLDAICITSCSGVVLYRKDYVELKEDYVAKFIVEQFIEAVAQKDGTTLMDQYQLYGYHDRQLDVFLVMCWNKSIMNTYVPKLVQLLRKHLKSSKLVDEALVNGHFERVKRTIEKSLPLLIRSAEQLDEKDKGKAKSFQDSSKFKSSASGASSVVGGALSSSSSQQQKPRKFEKKNKTKSDVNQDEQKAKAKGKQKRVWDDTVNDEVINALDFSDQRSGDTLKEVDASDIVDKEVLSRMQKARTAAGVDLLEMDQASANEEDDQDQDAPAKTSLFNFLPQLSLNQKLDKVQLQPTLQAMMEHLISKNVARDVAEHLCQSVENALVGTQIGTFTTLKSAVRSAVQDAVRQLLTPKNTTDILLDIKQTNLKQKRPYVLAFIGVNGVGKSTNLSKVCFWLLQNKFKILIAACDTFRSGAVEQLNTHVRNLTSVVPGAQLELFQRGYGKDAAQIAKDAISYAASNGFDVVMIDTAGRMQDNEPLMRSLAKLVSVNRPDKLIFVGEALVGNEAIDQLTRFNKAIKDFSTDPSPRQIDGVLLTKFDTVDDKVGAALTMTFVTGKPILFIGTGQTYTDLKKMNIKQITQLLLS
ncbi:hypothetical protein MP228_002326 [Amoeboaphelidium protococcarum]|nr:hypothetical protein MP228_002326 [Amoeboaphelidium protococcarum]